MRPASPEGRGARLSVWLAALIAACVLPLIAAVAWLAWTEVAARQGELERDAASKVRNVATALDQRLQARIGVLEMLAASPLLAERARWGEFHREALGFHAVFGGHVVLAGPGDAAGEPLRMLLDTRVPFSSALPPLPRPQGKAAVPEALATGRPAVGDLFIGPTAREPLVALAVSVDAVFPGHALLSTIEAAEFQRRLEQVALPADWALSLLDSTGGVIARRAPAGFVPAPAGAAAGRHRVALAAAPWTVELELSPQVLQAPARQAARALALVVAGAALLALGGGALAARRMARAVAALAEPARRADAATGIAEIDQARRRLDDAARRRDEARQSERAAEARLRATFELANVGIAHVGLDGRWLRVNRQLCRIVGYDEAQLLAMRFQDITHPDDLDADLAQMRQLLAGEIEDYEMDKRYLRRDGSEVWVALAVALARTEAGTPDYFIAVIDDISERKRLERRNREQFEALARSEAEDRHLLALAERSRGALLNVLQDEQRAAAALRTSEARLRNLFEQASDGIYVISADSRFLDANQRGLEMLGYSRDELLGLQVADILAPQELARPATELPRLMSGEPHLSEWQVKRRDGTIFPVEGSAKRLDGQSYLGIVRDLTERRRADASLRASEAYRRQLFEQMADGVLLVELDGRIADANPGAEAMFGCAPGALAGLRLPDLLAASERERWEVELPRMRAGTAALSEWELQRRDGSRFPAELSARPLDAQRLVAVLRDASARRAAEQALLHYQVELSELAQSLMAQERTTTQRVAQALHDHLGQTLALARLRLGALELRRGASLPAVDGAALEQIGRLLEQAVAEARQVLADLRPPLLEDEGLAAALDNELHSPSLAGGAAGGPAGVQLRVAPEAQALRWPADAEYAAFMVAREAATNALRHAQARSVSVNLDGGPGWLRLDVDDDGIGLASDLARGRPGHLGIVGMRERALAIGARFSASGRPEGGTRVTLTWGTGAP